MDVQWYVDRLQVVEGQLAGLADVAEEEDAELEQLVERAREAVIAALKHLGEYGEPRERN